jgi:ribonuclease E
MASNDDKLFSTDIASDVPGDAAVPAKKTAAKRAPRKATKKASAPQQAPPAEAPADVTATVETAGQAAPDVDVDGAGGTAKTPARKAAKRAPRKTARKSAAAPVEQEPAPVDVAPADVATVEPDAAVPEPSIAPEVPGFGLLFQAPEPTAAPRRRRATAPAAAPVPEQAPTSEAPSQVTPEQGDGTGQGSADDSADSDESGADGARRRRRRGGKGRRGRATGEGSAVETSDQDDVETSDEDNADATQAGQPSAEEDESGEPGESRRRTRRRRRGAASDNDDQPGTTTKVREPRPQRDEVTSVKGSTRLEAKKQRRREGREAGRRRTVITEAEFLARRESVERVMVVRHKQDRTQIGVLEDGVLVEHYVSSETNASMAGNVYLGRIQNVLPSMEAAFVDIGKGRNAVLYAGEVNWDAAGLDNRARRIENALSSGQGVLCQVTKDPIGHKGARLTSQVSLPGRYLVYVPDGNMMGISRKLPDTERARLKKILREVVPEKAGVIVRTAAEGASEDELRADVTRLTAAWEDIQAQSKSAKAPALLHGEPDLTVRVIRDVFNEDFARLVVSGDLAWEAVNGYVNTVAPDLADRIQKWTGEQDLFTHYRVDEQIAKAMDRKVWLPSGGSLVIDRTEAMTVVDVNTGKYVGSGGNLEETVTKNNIEAAEEVVRQLRLRDIGGIIVIDFIDMVLESNRDLIVRRLLECLGRDRTKHQVAEVTSLGLVQMTRKRVGSGLIEVFSDDCEHCNGRGIIVSPDPIDRPAGNDDFSGGDAGSGRGARGRRARGSGRDTGVSVVPEPKLAPGGPTPTQIAAVAHAAAIHAVSQNETAAPSAGEGEGDEQVTPQTGTALTVTTQPEELLVDQSRDVAAEPAAPARSRRRSPRSAKSPVVSPAPAAELVSEPPEPFEPPAAAVEVVHDAEVAEVAEVSHVAEVTAPAPRGRRKRARVVAPAGPPPGAGGI